jgi:hypothetical protein
LQISLTGDDTRVIDTRFAYTTSENLSEFALSVIFSNIGGRDIKINPNGITEIKWKHFDPGEGFRLKLIYASKQLQSVKVMGNILGVGGFDDITPQKGTLSFRTRGIWQMIVAGVLIVATLVLFLTGRRRVASASVMLVFVFQLWALLRTVFPPNPPF